MKTIEVTYDHFGRAGGKMGCYRARFRNELSRHEAASDPAQAVGQLVRVHPDSFILVPAQHGASAKLDEYSVPAAPLPLSPGVMSDSVIGRLVLHFPDAYGVRVALVSAQHFPRTSEVVPTRIV